MIEVTKDAKDSSGLRTDRGDVRRPCRRGRRNE